MEKIKTIREDYLSYRGVAKFYWNNPKDFYYELYSALAQQCLEEHNKANKRP